MKICEDKQTLKVLGKNRRKAEFVGVLYFLGTLILGAACFFPLVYGGVTGSMWVANFWKGFLDVKYFSGELLYTLSVLVPTVLYSLLLLVAVINLIRSFCKLHRLYRKKPSEKSGYNRNEDTMQKMGKVFSCTFFMIIFVAFLLKILSGAQYTGLFYIALLVGFIIHFWGGIVGAKTSLFVNVKNPIKCERKYGRFAPFMRNLAQFLFVSVILHFFAEVSLLSNLYVLAGESYLSTLFQDLAANKEAFILTIVFPAVQILMLVFIFAMVKHTTNTTEFHRDGVKAKGMKNFRVCAFFVFLIAALYTFASYALGSTTWFGEAITVVPTLNMVYLGVVAFAAFLLEVCMRKLPNVRKNYEEPVIIPEEPDEEPAQEQAQVQEQAQAVYTLPVQCLNAPAVFMQPDGTPIMVMPLVKTVNVPAPAQPQQEPMNVVEGPVQPEVAPALAPAPAPVAEPAPAPAPVEVPVVAPAPVVEEPSEPQEISDRVAYARKLKEKWIAAAKRQD
ncbi:MAG: hypothetical protein IJV80_00355 [Clostridia bacterium]|nr:hypothetical protein [Clostridia bacterium]